MTRLKVCTKKSLSFYIHFLDTESKQYRGIVCTKKSFSFYIHFLDRESKQYRGILKLSVSRLLVTRTETENVAKSSLTQLMLGFIGET